MVTMHTTLAMTWYIPMHVILWHGTNARHAMAWYIPMYIIILWHGTNAAS